MSGHSKWANIKRKKEVNDKVKSGTFAKISRLITLAVIEGGGVKDPQTNVKLRIAIDKAKHSNMPKDNIERSIERGAGPNKESLQEIVYEGFAPYGVALMILTTSDSPNRTSSEIRNILDKHGGKLVNKGAVSYMFQKCAIMKIRKKNISEEAMFQLIDSVGAYDVDQDTEFYYLFIPYEQLGKMKHDDSILYESVEIDYRPTATIDVGEESKAKTVLNLVDKLEALDDVHKVFSNL